MYKHLRIANNKALKHAEIINLGKVNIICGKNNSGKSTILEGISDNSKMSSGITFDVEKLSQINDKYVGARLKRGWTGSTPNPATLRPHYDKAINSLLEEKEVYFLEDKDTFFTQLCSDFESNCGKEAYELVDHELKKVFEGFFNSIPIESILLPPKRNLDSVERNLYQEEVKSNGEWLLNRLFFAKNQPDNSPEYELYKKVKQTFIEITSGYTFDLINDVTPNRTPREYLVKLKFQSEGQSIWIDGADCGLGLRDLIVILYFAINPEYKVILIEEPENHIHPEMQRRLLRFLSEETEKQYFISTHSNIFLNTTYANRIFFTTIENGEIKVSDATKRTEILNELGYSVSDNLVSDLIILVEGPTDTPIIEEYLKKFGIDAEYNIKTWALGGDIMAQLDLTVFSERYKVIALIDKDPKSASVRKKFVTKCNELNIPVTRLKQYAIENYFSIRALREVFKGQIPTKFTEIDPDKSLEEQIKINVKNNNRKLAQAMNKEEIEGTDLYKFFEKVKEICES